MISLSQYFTLEELSITQVRGVDNTPPPAIIAHLTILAAALESVRALLGAPILVNSGFRSRVVNDRVGGTPNSAHLYGWAADFICPAFGTPLEICEALAQAPSVHFDQLIEEGTWTHFSVDPRMRRQILTKDGRGGYLPGLPKVA